MSISRWFVSRLLLAALALAAAAPASAIPAFARKYGTSCLTCHVVYPKLTPFGEAFRRNGYRFPGVDSDYWKQEMVPMGQEAAKKTFPNSVWPDVIPPSVPLAFGANGQAFIHPDTSASAAKADNGANFTANDLVAETHVWAGASLDDTTTLWAEVTWATDGTLSVEHAQVLLNDLVGPKHWFNLVVGRGFPLVTSFAPHSSFIADIGVTNVPLAAIYNPGVAPGWVLVDNYNGGELNGVVAGRFDYSVGINAGSSNVIFGTEDVYGHVGYKLGGLRLDGEGSAGPADAMRPWAETALTLNLFAYHSNTHWTNTAVTPTVLTNDVGRTLGAAVRAQLESAELDVGFYADRHNRATATGVGATARVLYGELSYVLFPWLVPAVRVENVWIDPADGPTVNDLHIMPGIAFLLRPNIRLILVGNIEHAEGAPVDATGAPLPWVGPSSADWGPFTAAPSAPDAKVTEFESIALFLAWAI